MSDRRSLISALKPLLNENDGIADSESVSMFAEIMRDDKKIDSRDVYVNILASTSDDSIKKKLLTQHDTFSLLSRWLEEGISRAAKNETWGFVIRLLELFIDLPVTVDVLRNQSAPRIVKQLIKEDGASHEVRALAHDIVSLWKDIVIDESSVKAKQTGSGYKSTYLKAPPPKHLMVDPNIEIEIDDDEPFSPTPMPSTNIFDSIRPPKLDRPPKTAVVSKAKQPDDKRRIKTSKVAPTKFRSTGLEDDPATDPPPSKKPKESIFLKTKSFLDKSRRVGGDVKKPVQIQTESSNSSVSSHNSSLDSSPRFSNNATVVAAPARRASGDVPISGGLPEPSGPLGSPTAGGPLNLPKPAKPVAPPPVTKKLFESCDFMAALAPTKPKKPHIVRKKKLVPPAGATGVTVSPTMVKSENGAVGSPEVVATSNSAATTTTTTAAVNETLKLEPLSTSSAESGSSTVDVDGSPLSSDTTAPLSVPVTPPQSTGQLNLLGAGLKRNQPKCVSWKAEHELSETFYFELHDDERVNVNRLKHGDIKHMEMKLERALLKGTGFQKGGSAGAMRYGIPSQSLPEMTMGLSRTKMLRPWKLIGFDDVTDFEFGKESKEVEVQREREKAILGIIPNVIGSDVCVDMDSQPSSGSEQPEQPPRIIPLIEVAQGAMKATPDQSSPGLPSALQNLISSTNGVSPNISSSAIDMNKVRSALHTIKQQQPVPLPGGMPVAGMIPGFPVGVPLPPLPVTAPQFAAGQLQGQFQFPSYMPPPGFPNPPPAGFPVIPPGLPPLPPSNFVPQQQQQQQQQQQNSHNEPEYPFDHRQGGSGPRHYNAGPRHGGGRYNQDRPHNNRHHYNNYKPCYAFQKGSCQRGDMCKFSHAIN